MLFTRRNMIRALVSVGPLAVLGLGAGYASSRVAGQHGLERMLAGLFSDPSAAERVGQRYLDQHPQAAAPRWLRGQIAERWSPAEMLRARSDPRFLRRLIARQQASDFENGDVVSFEGWMLSRTELNVCALLASAA